MLFTTPLFLFLFLPFFFLVYLISGRYKNIVAVLFSAFFYAWGEPKFIFIVLASLVSDWWMGVRIYRETPGNRFRKIYLAVGVSLNLSLLLYFKYADFFIGNINSLFGPIGFKSLPLLNVALPLGISFITFEKITYLVDIYRGNSSPARTILLYAEYILLFPKLLAGPIVKYHDIRAQLEIRTVNWDDVWEGLRRFSLGMAKKVLLADKLSTVTDQVFGLALPSLSTGYAWIGVLSFTFQIYFDFSGYSDMAIGLSRIMGFRLMENFNAPYLSVNFTDFWRRWHISLSTWIKSYLYIPLGGNRWSVGRTYFNLVFCFFLSGLWHGASWTFVFWGLYHGVFLMFDKLFWLRVSARLPKVLNVMVTFLFVVIGWVFFRASNFHHAFYFLKCMFLHASSSTVFPGSIVMWFRSFHLIFSIAVIAVFVFPLIKRFWEPFTVPNAISKGSQYVWVPLLLFLSFISIAASKFSPFIYFRF